MLGKVQISPDNLAIQAGPRPCYQKILSSLGDPGDVAIIPTPFYACFPTTFYIKD